MNNGIRIRNIEPQEITIEGATTVAGITNVYVNGVDVTVGTKAYVIVPTKTSELTNDSGFITSYTETDPTVPAYVKAISLADINAWNDKQNELVSGVNIKTINNNSLLGSGDIQITATEYQAGTGIDITGDTISNTITSYQDLTDLPTIPNKTSELINDSGFITNTVDDLTNYLTTNVLETILPQASGTGTELYLQDTAPYTLHLELNPSEIGQFTTTGKNLLDQTNYITTRTVNGINFINNGDNTFSIMGTATANTSINILFGVSQIKMESGKTYYFYSSIPYNNITFNVSIPFKQDGTQKYLTANNSMTTSGTLTDIKLTFYTNSGTTIDAQNVKLMLVEGSSAGDYEPYTGGIPAPNPDYPQDIHTITDENSITISSNNLTNIENSNIHLITNYDGTTTENPYINSMIINTENHNNIYISGDFSLLSNALVKYGIYNEYPNISTTGTRGNLGSNGSISTTGNYILLSFLPDGAYTYEDIQNSFMINYGSTAAPHVPHEETVYEVDIPYGDRYGKMGDYSDRIYCNIPSDPDYSSNYQLNHWYLKTNIARVYLNNISNWTYDGLDGDGNYQFTGTNNIIIENPVVPNILICNYFGTTGNNKISITSNREIKVTFDPNIGITNLDEFESFINNNTVILYYIKNYPRRTELSQYEEFLNQWLNIINNSTAYNGGTVITQENYDLPFIITASTFKKVSN